jgi:putative CocE/NonD family hydrolase
LIKIAFFLLLPIAVLPESSATAAAPLGIAPQSARLLAQKTLIEAGKHGGLTAWQTSMLQIAAGKYPEAEQGFASGRNSESIDQAAIAIYYQIYAHALRVAQDDGETFQDAFTKSFNSVFRSLDDVTASQVIDVFGSIRDPYGPSVVLKQDTLKSALVSFRQAQTSSKAPAIDLLMAYVDEDSLSRMQPLSAAVIAADDRARYLIQTQLVRTPDGAMVDTLTMRSLHAPGKLPTLFGFTIYANSVWRMKEARINAAHGYASAVAYTRGKGASPDPIAPFEYDGADADTVIEWIARQPWSDGRVGMYGGSYNGFTQWAATKHLPPALKAIMPSAAEAPGIDFPMEGNIFFNFSYPWAAYVSRNKQLDQSHYDDRTHWNQLNRQWYLSGAPYRELERIDGTTNSIFRRWLEHPSYDNYWQKMIPYQKDFVSIDIPVLTTTGYYDGGQIGAIYYFSQHYRYNQAANHYLLIGPYDHLGAQHKARKILQGYAIDPVADIDIGRVIRYQWFDYIFRNGSKPELLKDKVNYEVMGENRWKHATSLSAMSNQRLRFYLGISDASATPILSAHPVDASKYANQRVDFAKRSTTESSAPDTIISDALDQRNALIFRSEPLEKSTEFSGLFSGKLNFISNKKDVDLAISLYEQMPDGSYFRLSWCFIRASYANDHSISQPPATGKKQSLPFQSGRLTSRLLSAGSKIVMSLTVIKQDNAQINYGTGKNVSDEGIKDAGEPLDIRWSTDSYLDIPIDLGSHE